MSLSDTNAGTGNGFGLMTLNLRFGLADDGPNGWSRRQGVYPDLFARLPMDFYCFQEANDFQATLLKSLLPRHEAIGQRVPAPPFWQNNLIFFDRRWRCLRRDHFYLSPTPDIPSRLRGSRWPRQCTMGLFARNGQRLVCATTHLDFAPAIQSAALRLIIERLATWPPDVPTILCGDFNASPASTGHDLLTRAIQPAFRNAIQPPYPPTHHGFKGTGHGEHIDWIVFRGLADAYCSGVFQEKIGGRFPSDHFPVWARWV